MKALSNKWRRYLKYNINKEDKKEKEEDKKELFMVNSEGKLVAAKEEVIGREVVVDNNGPEGMMVIQSDNVVTTAKSITVRDSSSTLKPYEYKGGDVVMKDSANLAISNYFNRSNEDGNFLNTYYLIPAELSLEVDGIGGMQPGNICHTDYIQHKYKMQVIEHGVNLGPSTFFQVFGINQKVDSSGWTTSLETKMRTNARALKALTPEYIKSLIVPEKPDVDIPNDLDIDIEGDLELEELDFEDFSDGWEYPPAPPKVETPIEDMDILGDVDLEELEFDDLSWWEYPSSPPPTDSKDSFSAKIPMPGDTNWTPLKFSDLGIGVKKDVSKITQGKKPETIEIKVEPKESPVVEVMIDALNKESEEVTIKEQESPKRIDNQEILNPVYKGTYEQNQLLYSIREDWRPLYRKSGGGLTGSQWSGSGNNRVENVLVRKSLSKAERAEFYHEYIEEPNVSGETEVKTWPLKSFALAGNPQSRTNRDIYWNINDYPGP